MTGVRNEARDADEMCRGFLNRAISLFDADAGSVRVIAKDGEQLHVLMSEGLSETLLGAQRCMAVRDCACGSAAVSGFPAIQDLTPRERDIVRILARGASNKDIARELDVAESTVKIHVRNVLRKLNFTSRVQSAVHDLAPALRENDQI